MIKLCPTGKYFSLICRQYRNTYQSSRGASCCNECLGHVGRNPQSGRTCSSTQTPARDTTEVCRQCTTGYNQIRFSFSTFIRMGHTYIVHMDEYLTTGSFSDLLKISSKRKQFACVSLCTVCSVQSGPCL